MEIIIIIIIIIENFPNCIKIFNFFLEGCHWIRAYWLHIYEL
jgi:hypothetical protein